MKKRFFLLAAFVAVSSAYADGLASPCTAQGLVSLQDYLSLSGDQCSVGILNYSYFTFNSNVTGGATALTASEIDLTPNLAGGLGGGFIIAPAPGYAFSVGEGQTATYNIRWDFVIDVGPVSGGADLDMDPPHGDTTITQTFCADAYFGDGGCPTGNQTLHVSTLPLKLHDSIVFSPPITSFAEVSTVISLKGDVAGGSGFDSTSSAPHVASSTPEPFSSMLALGGLIAIGAGRRFRQAH